MLMRRHHHPESPDYYSSLAAASAGVTSPSLSLGIISSSLEVCSFFNLIIWSCLFIFSLFFLSFLPPFVFGDYEKTKNISVSTRCVFVSFCQNGILYLSIRRVFDDVKHTHNTHWLSLFDNILLPNHPSSQRCFSFNWTPATQSRVRFDEQQMSSKNHFQMGHVLEKAKIKMMGGFKKKN